MKLKRIKRTTSKEDKIIGDLKNTFVSPFPHRQKDIRFSPSEAAGNVSLAYYRGVAVGRGQILKQIKKRFPKFYKDMNYE